MTKKTQKTYICDNLCDKAFTKSCYLKWHQLTHGSSQPRAPDYTRKRKYKCYQCGTAFLTSNHLRNHQVIQTGEKPHSCDRCGESFSRVNTLKNTSSFIPRRSLTTVSNVENTSSISRPALTQQISHTKEKIYSCQQYGKIFTALSAFVCNERIQVQLLY